MLLANEELSSLTLTERTAILPYGQGYVYAAFPPKRESEVWFWKSSIQFYFKIETNAFQAWTVTFFEEEPSFIHTYTNRRYMPVVLVFFK